MAKTTSQRRFDKRSAELAALRVAQPETFSRVWEQYVFGWLGEVRNRARAQRAGDCEEHRLCIFGVLTQARCLAHAVGAQTHGGVRKSLIVIEHECAKAVAALMDSRLYQFNGEFAFPSRKAKGRRTSRPVLGLKS